MAESRECPDEDSDDDGPIEIAVVGELNENESDLAENFLAIPRNGYCTIYFDSPGGSPYTALSLATMLKLRNVQATGIVTGECSSAAIWIFAACQNRFVTAQNVLLLHPMRWQSEENIGIAEASEWARHFDFLEKQMDQLLADLLGVTLQRIQPWLRPGRYVTGAEFAEAGLAELIPLAPFDFSRFEPEEG